MTDQERIAELQDQLRRMRAALGDIVRGVDALGSVSFAMPEWESGKQLALDTLRSAIRQARTLAEAKGE